MSVGGSEYHIVSLPGTPFQQRRIDGVVFLHSQGEKLLKDSCNLMYTSENEPVEVQLFPQDLQCSCTQSCPDVERANPHEKEKRWKPNQLPL